MSSVDDIRVSNLTKSFREILDLLGLNDNLKIGMIKKLESLTLERFSIVMLDRIKDSDETTIAKLQNILNSKDNNQDPNEQISKLTSTFTDIMTTEETKELYFYSKVAVLLEVIEPFLEEGSEENQAAVGKILSRNEDLKKAILAQTNPTP
jgi:hypothetical protein